MYPIITYFYVIKWSIGQMMSNNDLVCYVNLIFSAHVLMTTVYISVYKVPAQIYISISEIKKINFKPWTVFPPNLIATQYPHDIHV